eukprot:1172612-Prymnesium_polylepis.1
MPSIASIHSLRSASLAGRSTSSCRVPPPPLASGPSACAGSRPPSSRTTPSWISSSGERDTIADAPAMTASPRKAKPREVRL